MIELYEVKKCFGSHLVIDGVSLRVKRGEFFTLVGPSGCGKTTLLRIIGGLEEASEGQVRINGNSPCLACQQHLVGVAFQRPALIPSRTALRNVELTLEVTGLRKQRKGVRRLLTTFGINGDSMDKYPHELSGGMQQRVDLAAALVHDPEVLLLDEPFGPLDEITREKMGEWLGQVLSELGKTIVFVTHSVEEAVILSDRVAVMSPQPGHIVGLVEIDLPRPRTRDLRETEVFFRAVAEVRQLLYRFMNGKEE